jgi:uncharacterized membrane protein
MQHYVRMEDLSINGIQNQADDTAKSIHLSFPYYTSKCTVQEMQRLRVQVDQNRAIIADKCIQNIRPPDYTLINTLKILRHLIYPFLLKWYIRIKSTYMKLAYEIKGQWHMVHVTAVPIILLVTGVVPWGLYKRLKLRNLKEGIPMNMQMVAVLGI